MSRVRSSRPRRGTIRRSARWCCAGPPPLPDGSVPILTCFFNPTPEDRSFKLPAPQLPTTLLIDSADPAATERAVEGDIVPVKARSVVLTRSVYRK